MDYTIANYLIRTEGTFHDLVEGGIAGFRPFEAEYNPDAEPVLHLAFDEHVDDALLEFEPLYDCDFEFDLAHGRFGRSGGGFVFAMERNGSDEKLLFYKENGSPRVKCDVRGTGRPDPSLLRFGIWVMFGIAINPLHGIAIHSSVIVKDGGAVLFLGESGTGKSTHTRLWREHIEGAKLLNDDSPIIRLVDGVPTVFGSAWSGKTPCYHNRSFPIRGFVRLSQAPHNRIKRLNVLSAIGALLPSCPPAFALDGELQDNICETLSQMIAGVPVYHLECLPDADAAYTSYNEIFS